MKDEVVKKILGVEVKVLTDKGEERTLTLTDFLELDDNKSSISIDRDMCRTPQCKIDFHLECGNYHWRIV